MWTKKEQDIPNPPCRILSSRHILQYGEVYRAPPQDNVFKHIK